MDETILVDVTPPKEEMIKFDKPFLFSIDDILDIDDVLNIPKSDKKYFDKLAWFDDFYPDWGYWTYGVRGLKNGLYFILKMECAFKKAKEIASDERRVF